MSARELPRAPWLLVLAGHDPTGGAGIDADREAAAAFGVRATCIVTALTRQDGRTVHAIGAREPAAWLADARAVLAPPPAAVKTGLLPGAAHLRALLALADLLPAALPIVVDPLLAAGGGEVFLDEEGVEVLLAEVLPRAVHLVPNLLEAARLTGLAPADLAADRGARLAAAGALVARGARSVFLKGGHGREDPVQDLLLVPGEAPLWLSHPRVPGLGLHGSGCRTASAFAAQLARGVPPPAAAAAAGRWIARRIAAAAGS
ncbi:MAG: bifunctional hydroxymethylpyrimidine kinase/phosphomethylpyrimidine kinase [Planctomycetota bacterium]